MGSIEGVSKHASLHYAYSKKTNSTMSTDFLKSEGIESDSLSYLCCFSQMMNFLKQQQIPGRDCP